MPRRAYKGPEPTIAFSVIQSLRDALGEHRAVVRVGLSEFGLELHDESDPNLRLPLRRYLSFFEWLARELDRPFLGLELSQSVGAGMLGAVGYLFLNAANLEAALRSLLQYGPAIQDAMAPRELLINDDYVQLGYRILDDQVAEVRQDSEFTLGFDWWLIRSFSGGTCPLLRVDFQHDAPKRPRTIYRRVFDAPVLFRQSTNALHFPSSALATRPRNMDPHLFPILEAHVRDTLARRNQVETFSDRVEACLTENIMRQGPRAKVIAGVLGMSEATLHRRLRAEGTTFKTVVDDTAKSLATVWIKQRQIPISAIARLLGYAETACLTRAFRRWYGVSPRQFRRATGEGYS